MKTEKSIFVAFILNLSFSVFEFAGGIFSGSVAILSDAIHDMGDSLSLGISFFLEKISKKQPDDKYTFGYTRYSVLGSLVTTLILLYGSVMVILNAISRIITPVEVNYDSMILFAIIGITVNFGAVLITRHGNSLNQKAVNLHMLEDVLGWIVVLIGSFIMRFTHFTILDPIMSIGVAIFILVNVFKNLKEITDLFLEKIPRGININDIREHLLKIDGITDVHHIHIRSIDSRNNHATMHIVTNSDSYQIKEKVRKELQNHNINHVTLELESENEHCHQINCRIDSDSGCSGCHHHSH